MVKPPDPAKTFNNELQNTNIGIRYTQGDSPSMFTLFFFNNAFIQNLILEFLNIFIHQIFISPKLFLIAEESGLWR